MKMYKKSDLILNNGMLVSADGDIVVPDARIVMQANELETIKQKAKYLATQPAATPEPSLDGFERLSIKDSNNIEFHASTPTMDKKAEEAMIIMGELDDMMVVDRANDMIKEFDAIIDFVSHDFVVDCGVEVMYCFDTPLLGSVLELTKDDVIDAIAAACGMDKDGLTKRETVIGDDLDELLAGLADEGDDEE